MARMKAPAGGIITNDTFQQGGRFLPRALGKIRDVVARKRAKKLARVVPTNQFSAAVESALDGSQQQPDSQGVYHGDAVHGAIADYLAEHGDPREDLVRGRHPKGSLAAYHEAARAAGPSATNTSGNHQFADGTRMYVEGRKGPGGKHWYVQWTPRDSLRYHGAYGVHMDHPTFQSWFAKFAPKDRAAISTSLKKTARAGQRPFKLARPGPDPVDVTIKAPEGVADRALTLDELKQIENSFQLPEKHRLSSKVVPKVKKGKRVFEAAVQVGKNGQIQVKTNHVAQFFDAIHKTLVPDRRSLRRVLNGPYSDPVKTAHLVLNLGADLDRAGKESGGSGGINWYTDKIREFDDLTRAYLGRPLLDDATHARVRDAIAAGRHADVPGIIRGTGGADLPESTHGLFKALLAFTSGAQNPVANTAVATKMYRAGQRAAPSGADPLLHIPEYNHEDLANWLAASKVAPPPTNPDELVRWVLHHGAEPHYKTREVQYVHRPDHDDHGKALKYQAAEPQYDENDEVVPGTSKKRWVPFGDAKTIDSLYRKHSGHVKKLAVPILSESGALQPKNWTVRGEAVVRALDRFKRIIKHVGGDHGKALTWLMAEHPIEEITKVTGAEPDAGYYPAGTKTIPGAFTFGPKFGPFFLNLLIPDHPELAKHLTADMWWARTWQRYLGRTYGKKKVASGPTSSAERRAMWEAAKTVAGKHGLTVAALQAALWYHEQNLWRLFGAKNASYDYSHGIRDAIKKKLSRPT